MLAIKANALVEKYGHEVYIVESDHRNFLPESAVFSSAVHFVDLDIHYDRLPPSSVFNPFGSYQRARRLHRRRLKNFLRSICPDIVISLGSEDKSFIASIPGCWKTVREFHWTTTVRNMLYGYLSPKNRIIARLADFIETYFVLRKFDMVVLLSELEKKLYWSGDKNICVIPNPQTFQSDIVAELKNKKLISIGRLDQQKTYGALLRIFSVVNRHFPDWKLEIYGDGPEQAKLGRMIEDFGLVGVVELKGNTAHIREALLEASCFVLSSHWEGMPLVIIEAMTCGLPIVSYDCPSGPGDLIEDGVNGYLIPVGDEAAFASRIMELIQDKDLRMKLGTEARMRSDYYSQDRIMMLWQQLFEDLNN